MRRPGRYRPTVQCATVAGVQGGALLRPWPKAYRYRYRWLLEVPPPVSPNGSVRNGGRRPGRCASAPFPKVYRYRYRYRWLLEVPPPVSRNGSVRNGGRRSGRCASAILAQGLPVPVPVVAGGPTPGIAKGGLCKSRSSCSKFNIAALVQCYLRLHRSVVPLSILCTFGFQAVCIYTLCVCSSRVLSIRVLGIRYTVRVVMRSQQNRPEQTMTESRERTVPS